MGHSVLQAAFYILNSSIIIVVSNVVCYTIEEMVLLVNLDNSSCYAKCHYTCLSFKDVCFYSG